MKFWRRSRKTSAEAARRIGRETLVFLGGMGSGTLDLDEQQNKARTKKDHGKNVCAWNVTAALLLSREAQVNAWGSVISLARGFSS